MTVRWEEIREEGAMVNWVGFGESGNEIATISTRYTPKGFAWVLKIGDSHVLGFRQLEEGMPRGEKTLTPWKPRVTGTDLATHLLGQADEVFGKSRKALEGLGW
jgi:hypothetical protein